MLVATIVGLRAVIRALWQPDPAGDPADTRFLKPYPDGGGEWMNPVTG